MKAAIRIECAPRESQAPAPPTARKADPAIAPTQMKAAPALRLHHPVPFPPQNWKTPGPAPANAALRRAPVRSAARPLAPSVPKAAKQAGLPTLAAFKRPNTLKFPG